ncbi:MAG: endonuclease/exonuclease/phosphatase family protein [Clostridia bacterium]|nr:endonuclease/exonuclease/phosphatase family protein [Clostridia bacterium]
MKKLFYTLVCLSAFSVLGCSEVLDNSQFVPDYEYATDDDSGQFEELNPDEVGDDQLKVLSFNVRTSTSDTGTEHAWNLRRDACCEVIIDENPTVFGVQEAHSNQMTYISENTGYASIGVGREDGGSTGEIMGIFYKEDLVTLEDWGTFWLSETPDVPSQGFGANYYRCATWAIFLHKLTGKRFFYMNTHLDTSSSARAEEVPLIVSKLAELNPNGYPTLLTADFNAASTSSIFDSLKEVLYEARSTAPITDTGATYNGWGSGSSVIDHIFYSGLEILEFGVNRNEYLGVQYASDHYAIYALFNFE